MRAREVPFDAATVEDLEYLASLGEPAHVAAERCGWVNVEAMHYGLRRNHRLDLWDRLMGNSHRRGITTDGRIATASQMRNYQPIHTTTEDAA